MCSHHTQVRVSLFSLYSAVFISTVALPLSTGKTVTLSSLEFLVGYPLVFGDVGFLKLIPFDGADHFAPPVSGLIC